MDEKKCYTAKEVRDILQISKPTMTKCYKPVWQCKNATSNGIASCPDCKSIDESVLESAFLDVLRQLIDHYDDIMDSLVLTLNTVLSSDDGNMRPAQLDSRIKKLEKERNRLTENLLDDIIVKEKYDLQTAELNEKLSKYKEEKALLAKSSCSKTNISKRMDALRQTLQSLDPLDQFDRIVFDSIVERVIAGGYDSDGNTAPYKLTFVLKDNQNITADYNLEKYKMKQRESRKKGRAGVHE